MQRALAERQAAGQVEHFSHAADLLKKFQELRQAAPDLSAGQVLDRISAADRGSMLQTLLLASAQKDAGRDLWAVAGPYLVRVDPGVKPARTELTPLPPTLGPLRSVQPAVVHGDRVLLVGARAGFMVVRPGGRDEPEIYVAPGVESQLGFSRVVYEASVESGNGTGHGGSGFAACHGEAGVVRWALGRTAGPVSSVRPERFTVSTQPPPLPPPLPANAGFAPNHFGGPPPLPGSFSGTITASHPPGPRNLQVIDEHRLLFSVGSRLWLMSGEDLAQLPPEADAEIIAIVPAERHLLVVHEDGTVCTFDRSTRQVTSREKRGGRVRSAGALPWLGGVRVLLAAEEGPVECVGTDDPLITQYGGPYRGLRVVTGSAEWVAGVTADRQRLVLWHPWDGRQPAAEVYLTGQTRHRIADVAFG